MTCEGFYSDRCVDLPRQQASRPRIGSDAYQLHEPRSSFFSRAGIAWHKAPGRRMLLTAVPGFLPGLDCGPGFLARPQQLRGGKQKQATVAWARLMGGNIFSLLRIASKRAMV
jgi:hypothetical protein